MSREKEFYRLMIAVCFVIIFLMGAHTWGNAIFLSACAFLFFEGIKSIRRIKNEIRIYQRF